MALDAQGPIVERAKNMLVQPKVEWERIDAEPMSVAGIFRNWVLLLAAIPPVAGLIGAMLFGYRFLGVVYRPTIVEAVGQALVQYVLSVAAIFVMSLVIEALAPSFGGTKDRVQATKVAAFSWTAAWLAGIFGILPQLAMLAGLIGALYSLYLLYLGLPLLMKVAADKAVGYTAAVIVAAIVVWLVIGALAGAVSASFLGTRPAPTGELTGTVTIPGAGTVDVGALESSAKELEEAARKMEAEADNMGVAADQ